MYLVLDPKHVKREYVLTHTPVNNTVMENSNFIRLLYSDGVVALNGIHVRAKLWPSRIESYFNKYKCTINVEKCREDINELIRLEEMVLEQADIQGKRAVKRIGDQLRQGSFKLFSDATFPSGDRNTCVYILKMSGLWETETEYGVTHKFMEIRHRPSNRPS